MKVFFWKYPLKISSTRRVRSIKINILQMSIVDQMNKPNCRQCNYVGVVNYARVTMAVYTRLASTAHSCTTSTAFTLAPFWRQIRMHHINSLHSCLFASAIKKCKKGECCQCLGRTWQTLFQDFFSDCVRSLSCPLTMCSRHSVRYREKKRENSTSDSAQHKIKRKKRENSTSETDKWVYKLSTVSGYY